MSAAHQAVLLVDDSPDTLEMYALGLTHAGYRPITASDADTALGHLRTEQPDAVVTDLQLIGRSGWLLIEAIRKDPATRQIPIIVLTGRSDPSITVNAKRVGCVAVLTKPCLPDELAHVLHRILPDGGTHRRTQVERAIASESLSSQPTCRPKPDRRLRPRDGVAGEPQRQEIQAMILGTYRAMPGMRLQLAQAARLFGLRRNTCQIVLDDLVRNGILHHSTDGRYVGREGTR